MSMSFLKWSILVCFLLGGISCLKDKSNGDNDKIYSVLDLDKAEKCDTLRFSDVFNSPRIILLDDSVESLLGDIDKVEIVDNNIFVLDGSVAKTLFMFNDKGRFIRKIGRLGNGKGEYISPIDFSFDRERMHIYILDRQQRRIHEYDYTSGEHIRSIIIPHFSANMFCYKDFIYMDDPGQKHVFRRIPGSEEGEDLLLSRDIQNKGWRFTLSNTDGVFLNRFSKTPLFTHLFMDTVYRIDENRIIYPYLVLQSEYMMQKEDIEDLNVDKNPMDMFVLVKKDKYYNLQTYMEKEDFLFFRLDKGNKTSSFYYDKKNLKIYCSCFWAEDLLFNSLDFNLTHFRFVENDQNMAYFYLKPDHFSTLLKLKDFDKKNKQSVEIQAILDKKDDFNGAIICYEYKK